MQRPLESPKIERYKESPEEISDCAIAPSEGGTSKGGINSLLTHYHSELDNHLSEKDFKNETRILKGMLKRYTLEQVREAAEEVVRKRQGKGVVSIGYVDRIVGQMLQQREAEKVKQTETQARLEREQAARDEEQRQAMERINREGTQFDALPENQREAYLSRAETGGMKRGSGDFSDGCIRAGAIELMLMDERKARRLAQEQPTLVSKVF